MNALTDIENRKFWDFGLRKASLKNDYIELEYKDKTIKVTYEFYYTTNKFYIIENHKTYWVLE